MRWLIGVVILLGLSAGGARATSFVDAVCEQYKTKWDSLGARASLASVESFARSIPANCPVRATALRRIDEMKVKDRPAPAARPKPTPSASPENAPAGSSSTPVEAPPMPIALSPPIAWTGAAALTPIPPPQSGATPPPTSVTPAGAPPTDGSTTTASTPVDKPTPTPQPDASPTSASPAPVTPTPTTPTPVVSTPVVSTPVATPVTSAASVEKPTPTPKETNREPTPTPVLAAPTPKPKPEMTPEPTPLPPPSATPVVSTATPVPTPRPAPLPPPPALTPTPAPTPAPAPTPVELPPVHPFKTPAARQAQASKDEAAGEAAYAPATLALAEAYLTRAQSEELDTSANHYWLGRIHFDQGKHRTAIADFSAAILAAPDDGAGDQRRAYLQRAIAEYAEEQYSDAQLDLERYKDLADRAKDQAGYLFYAYSGKTDLALGDNAGAAASFGQALTFQPDDRASLFDQGVADARLNNLGNANRELRAAERLAEQSNTLDFQTFYFLAIVEFLQGDKESAASDYAKALKYDDGSMKSSVQCLVDDVDLPSVVMRFTRFTAACKGIDARHELMRPVR
jgi:hypothetical protein